MTLWIGHDNDDPLGVDMSLACEAATESIDSLIAASISSTVTSK